MCYYCIIYVLIEIFFTMQEAVIEELEKGVAPIGLAQILDGHLYTLIRLSAKANEPITEEQAEGMQRVAELRDLLKGTGDE